MPCPPVTRKKLVLTASKLKLVAENAGRVAAFCTQLPLPVMLKVPTESAALSLISPMTLLPVPATPLVPAVRISPPETAVIGAVMVILL